MHLPSTVITLEEHAAFPSLGDTAPLYAGIWPFFPTVRAALRDHSTSRLSSMDAGRISFQTMSQLPGTTTTNIPGCRAANDEMAAAIAKHPDRLSGFAALPMADPDEAAAELERAVTQLGLVGAMVDNHLEDMTMYDAERFWCVWEAAERLNVPIYIHPAPPSEAYVRQRFEGNYSEEMRLGLSVGVWGWHEAVGLHVLKLYAAGVFKRFPRLKVIIGHNGEMLPMMLDRVDSRKYFKKAGLGTFLDVWNNNMWITTSGMFSVRALQMLLLVTKKDRVMFSIDTPLSSSEEGKEFLEAVVESAILSQEELTFLAGLNAKRLLRLK